VWQKDLTQTYGCPEFLKSGQPILAGQAFCWCGLGISTSDSFPAVNLSSEIQVSANGKFHGWCHNRHDGEILKARGKRAVSNDMKTCEQEVSDQKNSTPPPSGSQLERKQLAWCMVKRPAYSVKGGLSLNCARCFAASIQCSVESCLEECACAGYTDPHCSKCMNQHCKYGHKGTVDPYGFDYCSGLKTSAASENDLEDTFDFFDNDDAITHEGEAFVV
jgi:hypothetical protein